MAATIIIKADTEQARTEIKDLANETRSASRSVNQATNGMSASLNDVERASHSASDAMEESSRVASSMGQRLNTAANVASAGLNAMSLAAGGARMAMDLGKRSIEGYFNASEEGRVQLEALREQWGAMLGQLTEAVLGTDDTAEAFEKLSEVIMVTTNVVSGLVRGVTDTISALGRYTGVSALVRTAFRGMSNAMRDASEESTRSTEAIIENLNSLSELSRSLAVASPEGAIQASDDILRATAENAAALILSNRGVEESSRDWRANFDQLVDTMISGEEQIMLTTNTMDRFTHSMTERGEIIELSEAFRAAGDEGIQMGFALEEAGRRSNEARNSLENLNRVVEDTNESMASSSRSSDTGEDPVVAALERQAQAQMDAQGVIQSLMRDEATRLEYARIAQDEMDALAAREVANQQGKAEAVRQATQAMIAANKDVVDSDNDNIRKGIEAQESFATSAITGLSAIIAGEKDATKNFIAMVGQKLMAEGTQALFKGGISLAFGDPRGASGIAAGLAAIVAGQAMLSGNTPSSNGSSPVASGTAPVANSSSSQERSTTSVEIVNNFGLAQDPRYTARAVSDAMNDARRYGMA
jgi:hypothetical protein